MAKRQLQTVNEPVDQRNFDGEGTLRVDMRMVNAKPGTATKLAEKVEGLLDPIPYDDEEVFDERFTELFTYGDMRALRNILRAVERAIDWERRDLAEAKGLKLVKPRRAVK